MTDIIEEARAMLAGLRSHPWRRDRDMVQGAGCILVAKCIDADVAGFAVAAPRLLAALADECERLRKQNSEYHRRAQVAEAAVLEETTRGHRLGRSVGRSLANAAASTAMRECERLRAENARLREAMPTDEERYELGMALDSARPAFLVVFPWLARLDAAKEGR